MSSPAFNRIICFLDLGESNMGSFDSLFWCCQISYEQQQREIEYNKQGNKRMWTSKSTHAYAWALRGEHHRFRDRPICS